jgi:hypothetical protein
MRIGFLGSVSIFEIEHESRRNKFGSPTANLKAKTYIRPMSLEQFSALESFFFALDGIDCKWRKPFSNFGEPRNFTTSVTAIELHQRCQNWQGVHCEEALHLFHLNNIFDWL